MGYGMESQDRRHGQERRTAARRQRQRLSELWLSCRDLAGLVAESSPGRAIEAAWNLLDRDDYGAARDVALVLAASAFEQAVFDVLKTKLPESGIHAALSATRSQSAKRDFIDFTIKDLLRRAISREPVGRRAVPARIWNASMDMLFAKNAVLNAGGASLANAFGGDEHKAHLAVKEWLVAASKAVKVMDELKRRITGC